MRAGFFLEVIVMSDIADRADEVIEQATARALTFRKPVPTVCECGEPCYVIPTNGATSRFCRECYDAEMEARK